MNRLALLFALVLPAAVFADDSQLDERLNPEIEAAEAVKVDYKAYPNVKIGNNKVSLNGDDWSALGAKYRAALAGDSLFSVVYLGDSHIQADFGGAVLRSRLSSSRPAGRGIIIPFKLAGTNQPNDYKITMHSAYTASKLMKTPWSTEMPFTGIGLKPSDRSFTLGITAPAATSKLRFHTRGGVAEPVTIRSGGENVPFELFTDGDGLSCALIDRPLSEFDITFKGDGDAVFGGIELLADSVGVLVHSIGNNGATFSDYSLPDRFGSELAALHPDLVVVALGTNEAFGRITVEELQNNIDNLVRSIRSHSPETKILLVGPAECYRRTYRRTRRGRRRRGGQVVNAKVATIARGIRQFAESENIPYYNHFAVAGNAASQRGARILGADGVHYTANGYRLWGNLLADALLDAMKQ